MGEGIGPENGFLGNEEFQIPVKEYDPTGFHRDRTPSEKAADADALDMLEAAVRYEGMRDAKAAAAARERDEILPPKVHTPDPKHLNDLGYESPKRPN